MEIPKSKKFNKKEYDRKYYLLHRDKIKERSKLYRLNNKLKVEQKRNEWRKNNPQKELQYYLKSVAGRNDLINEIKKNGCSICGYDRCNAALDFHHVEKSQKKFNIGHKVKVDEDLIEEIHKCILLCKNCHTEVEREEKRNADS